MSGAQEDGSVEAGTTPAHDLYREKPVSTLVRILTVLAYLLSVSLAAILLSVYYICVWKSPDLPMSAHEMLNARRGDHNDYTAFTYDASYNLSGGSNNTVNGTATLNLDKFANFTNNIESAETEDAVENSTSLPLQHNDNTNIEANNSNT